MSSDTLVPHPLLQDYQKARRAHDEAWFAQLHEPKLEATKVVRLAEQRIIAELHWCNTEQRQPHHALVRNRSCRVLIQQGRDRLRLVLVLQQDPAFHEAFLSYSEMLAAQRDCLLAHRVRWFVDQALSEFYQYLYPPRTEGLPSLEARP